MSDNNKSPEQYIDEFDKNRKALDNLNEKKATTIDKLSECKNIVLHLMGLYSELKKNPLKRKYLITEWCDMEAEFNNLMIQALTDLNEYKNQLPKGEKSNLGWRLTIMLFVFNTHGKGPIPSVKAAVAVFFKGAKSFIFCALAMIFFVSVTAMIGMLTYGTGLPFALAAMGEHLALGMAAAGIGLGLWTGLKVSVLMVKHFFQRNSQSDSTISESAAVQSPTLTPGAPVA